jgi:DNA-binding response OmpR family regulator
MFGKILIVESNIDTANIIHRILSKDSFEVYHATLVNLKSEIDIIKPDLIVLDHLPENELNGSDFCKEFKLSKQQSDLPIILISESTDLEQIAKDCDADAYILKPFDDEDFCNTVKDMLSI